MSSGMGRAKIETKLMVAVGLVMIASGVSHLGVWSILGGSLGGDVSWRKPILFGLSLPDRARIEFRPERDSLITAQGKTRRVARVLLLPWVSLALGSVGVVPVGTLDIESKEASAITDSKSATALPQGHLVAGAGRRP